MSSGILLINAGSSSLKVSLFRDDSSEQLASVNVDWSQGTGASYHLIAGEQNQKRSVSFTNAASAFKGVLPQLLQYLPNDCHIVAIGHRVVHGGDYTSGAEITDDFLEKLQAVSVLAPLHNPPSLATYTEARKAFPDIPHIAVFDTAFHRTMRAEAFHYAIPQEWAADWGIKRYGFHGLSHSYCAERAAELMSQPLTQLRLIVCHLGHGCSATAIKNGKCVDTTMGFTPLEGLMMATRSGSIDAGAVLYVQQHHGLSTDKVSKALNTQSGILGVSGVSADMRQVLQEADRGHQPSRLAIAMFCYRIQQAIAALMVSSGGCDALIFTAGIGENSAPIRENICQGINFLGFDIDSNKNYAVELDSEITGAHSKIRIFVIATREDKSMLREVKQVLKN